MQLLMFCILYLVFVVQLPRFLSWRVVVPSLALYSGIYAYERLTWTDRSKEHALKTQVSRASTINCSPYSVSGSIYCNN